MKILHTADLHLKDFEDERWNSLVEILSIARRHSVGALTVSGDLFDRDVNAENLRARIRGLFSGNGFPVIIIPGNHDAEIMSDMYFGGDAVILKDPPDRFEKENICFWGLPFESADEARVLERIQDLKNLIDRDKLNILLYHGELLDIFFRKSDLGEATETGYMPVRLSFFHDVPLNYVLAGHFHTNFDVRLLPGRGYFVYPGSPVSITRRETGRRKINLFNTGEPPSEYFLDTPHYEEITVALNPFSGLPPVEEVERAIKDIHPGARLILTISGYINKKKAGINENEFVRAVETIAPDSAEILFEFRDIQHIIEDELFRAFMKKLDAGEYDKTRKNEIIESVIKAMTEADLK